MADMRKFDTLIRLPRFSSDPVGVDDGVIYYNTTSNTIRQRLNGSFGDIPSSSLTGLALNDGEIIVGNASNLSAAIDTDTVGDIQADHVNGLVIKAGVIVDADINASAAIDASKIADGSVSNSEFQFINSLTSNAQTQIDSKVAKAGDTMSGNLAMGGNKVTSLGTPTAAGDATPKSYVDALSNGIKWKQSVLVATTANITLSGEQTIDGVLTSASRVLVKNQTLSENNGIYVSAAGAWSRSEDADSAVELTGAAVFVEQGTANGDKGFAQSSDNITLGTTSIVWFQNFGSGLYVADGNGIELSGSTFSLELDGTTLSKSASGLKVNEIANAQIASGAAIDASKIADGSVSNSEFQFINSLTSNAQTQLDGKANTALSNLASVAINTTLVSDSDAVDDLGTSSLQWNNAFIKTKIESNAAPGAIGTGFVVQSKNVTGAVNSANVNFISGTVDTSGQTSGISSVRSGDCSVAGTNSGGVSHRSGDITATSGAGTTGQLTLRSGNIAAGTNTGASGNAVIATGTQGAGNSGATGNVSALSGNNSGSGNSGSGTFGSGTASSGNSGAVALQSGNSTSGSSGAVTIQTGTAGATRGAITLSGNTINLSGAGTVSSSLDINPSANDARSLGSASLNYLNTHVKEVISSANLTLTASSGNIVLSPSGSVDANTHQIINVVDPSSAQHAATKAYVDSYFTAGDIKHTSFTGLANNTADQNITGFAFANGTVRSFEALVSVFIDATTDNFAQYKLYGIQKASSWEMTSEHVGDDITGFSFAITSAGQIQASIGNITGFSTSKINFRASATLV